MGAGRVVVHLGPRRGRVLAVSTACEALLAAVAAVVAWAVADIGFSAWRFALIALLASGAGIQNGTARKLAVPDLTTTVLTLTITGAAFESKLAGGANSRIGRRGLSIFAMFAGALVGAMLVLHVHVALPLLLALVLLVPVAVAAGRLSRSKPAWDQAT
jgi:uncharacterized membrane protein YoaK (UPF0700 family)